MRNSKFFYKSIWLFCFLVLCIGCKKSVESYVREANEAMNEGDYTTAYSVVDLMLGMGDEYLNIGKDLNNKIVSNEIGCLFETPNDPLLGAKIIKILKERDIRSDQVVDMVLGMAKSLDRKDLILEMLNFKWQKSNTNAAHYLPNNVNYISKEDITTDFFNNKINLLSEYEKVDYEDLESLYLQILSLYKIRGEKKEGLQEYYYGLGEHYGGEYLKDAAKYNQLCDRLLLLAINSKRFDIAQKIVNSYIQDPEITMGSHPIIKVDGIEVDGNHSYIKYNWNSKNAAQKKLNEAKKN